MGHKTFDIEVDPSEAEGPSFDLVGRKFHCLAVPNAGVMADLVAARGKKGWDVQSICKFIRGCLVESDEEMWDEVIHGKSTLVRSEHVGSVFEWLIEEYTDRPSIPPSG